jgi:hypothetical protein
MVMMMIALRSSSLMLISLALAWVLVHVLVLVLVKGFLELELEAGNGKRCCLPFDMAHIAHYQQPVTMRSIMEPPEILGLLIAAALVGLSISNINFYHNIRILRPLYNINKPVLITY